MPPPLLFNLESIDLSRLELTREQIYQWLPQRFEFMVLDGVCHLDTRTKQVVAFCDVRPDAWWVRGHVPGRPLLPGVLMIEMGAQAAALEAKIATGSNAFIGFGGVDKCKFREAVIPPTRLYILAVAVEQRPRRIITDIQGVVDGKIMFEATITGLALP